MNTEQKEALKKVLEYLAEEKDHYEQFVENNGEPTMHIYHSVLILKQLTGDWDENK